MQASAPGAEAVGIRARLRVISIIEAERGGRGVASPERQVQRTAARFQRGEGSGAGQDELAKWREQDDKRLGGTHENSHRNAKSRQVFVLFGAAALRAARCSQSSPQRMVKAQEA